MFLLNKLFQLFHFTNCGKTGHVKKDCLTCSFCKKFGHQAKVCRTRLAQAKGKFCEYCNLKDSHDTSECYDKKAQNKQKSEAKQNNVRMVQTNNYEDNSDDNGSSNWSPNIIDEEEEYTAGSGTSNQY